MKAAGDSPSDRPGAAIRPTEAEILENRHCGAEQYLLRLHSPALAQGAAPGQFAHIQCHPQLPLPRPMSYLRADERSGQAEILYKIVGRGTRLLATRGPGETIRALGPAGRGFRVTEGRPRPLLIGGGLGMPPILFLAESLAHSRRQPLVLIGSELPFPFRPRPSARMATGIPPHVTACVPLLEDLGFASRLASNQGRPGCFEGHVTELGRHWLRALDQERLQEVELFACGPKPMLAAAVQLARDYRLPCQIAVEEHMACATGGCAGCAIPITAAGERRMMRVCVDGPVFDGRQAYPAAECGGTASAAGAPPAPGAAKRTGG